MSNRRSQLRTLFQPRDPEWQEKYRARSRGSRWRVLAGPLSGAMRDPDEAALVIPLASTQRSLWFLLSILSLPVSGAITWLASVLRIGDGPFPIDLVEDPEPMLFVATPIFIIGVINTLATFWAARQNRRRVSGKIDQRRFEPPPPPTARRRWIAIGLASLMVGAAFYFLTFFSLSFAQFLQTMFFEELPFEHLSMAFLLFLLCPFVVAKVLGHPRFLRHGAFTAALGITVAVFVTELSLPVSLAVLAPGLVAIRAPHDAEKTRLLTVAVVVALSAVERLVEHDGLLMAIVVAIPALIGMGDELALYAGDPARSWRKPVAAVVVVLTLLAAFPLHGEAASRLVYLLPEPRPIFDYTGRHSLCREAMTAACAQEVANRSMSTFAWIPVEGERLLHHQFVFAHSKLVHQSLYTSNAGGITLFSVQMATEPKGTTARKIGGTPVRIWRSVEEDEFRISIFWDRDGKTYELSGHSSFVELVPEEYLIYLFGKIKYTHPAPPT